MVLSERYLSVITSPVFCCAYHLLEPRSDDTSCLIQVNINTVIGLLDRDAEGTAVHRNVVSVYPTTQRIIKEDLNRYQRNYS
jgi:hypothetical protein